MTGFREDGKPGGTRTLFLLGLLVVLGAAIYSNTLRSPFVFDDGPSITRNPAITDLDNFFINSTGYDKYPTRFLGLLTFALNYRIGGLDPFGYHVVNILIHILNSLLVYFVAAGIFRSPFLGKVSSGETSRGVSFAAAVLFLVHPVQTEAVTFIVQRLTSLAAMFSLASLHLYARYAGSENPRSWGGRAGYALSVLSCLAAMKTKEITFVLPVIISLYDLFFLEGSARKRILRLSPYLLAMAVIPLSLVNVSEPLGTLLSSVGSVTRVQTDLPRWDYLLTQISVVATYVRLLFLPVNQNLDYDYPTYHSLLTPRVALSGLFLLLLFGVAAWAYLRSKREGGAEHRVISFGIVWFFISLSVESSLIPIVDVCFEHRLYLPSVGAFLSVAMAGSMVLRRRDRKVRAGALVLAVAALSVATYQRNSVWKDDLTLWRDTVAKSPGKARPHYNLGNSLYMRGRVKEAIGEYRSAIRVDPVYADAHLNLGVAYAFLGVVEGAQDALEEAVRLKPNDAETRYNLGLLYSNKGWNDRAIVQYEKALSLKPGSAKILNNLGIALAEAGRVDDAIGRFREGLRINPGDRELVRNLGNAHRLKNLSK